MLETPLFELVKELDRKINGQAPDDLRLVELSTVVGKSYLDDPADVPSWLLDLFDALINNRLVPPTPQVETPAGSASPQVFLVNLADVVDMNYLEGDDFILVQFPEIGLEARISLEESEYTVRSIE